MLNVTFRPLPFYDLVDEILSPCPLVSDGCVGRAFKSQIEFKLTIEQADMLAWSAYSKQIILRFGHLDNTCEQDDNFPPDVSVLVNGVNINLPPAISNPNKPNIPPKRPGHHVDITKQCKFCPFISNSINIKWFLDPNDPKRAYVITVIIAEKNEADVLLQRIKERGFSNPNLTKDLISGTDNEVATMNLQSSLVCPLGKVRMVTPCKSVTCQHIPCFDAMVYLQMNEKKPSWICPVCYKPAYFQDLLIDGFFIDILQNTSSNTTEVTLNLDGTWSPVLKTEQHLTSSTNNKSQPEIICISDDDD